MVRFLISTTDELRDALKCEANQRGQTLCGLVRQILWDWVKRNNLAGKSGNTSEGQEM